MPTPGSSDDWTVNPVYTRYYDNLKVTAVLNWIRGLDHTGTATVGVPAIFGMNFQAVSVGEKVTADGYTDAAGTPSAHSSCHSTSSITLSWARCSSNSTSRHLTQSTLLSSVQSMASRRSTSASFIC